MEKRRVDIQWEELEQAVERNSAGVESYLDLRDGSVLTIAPSSADASKMRELVASQADDFLRVIPASSREQYRWMEQFVVTMPDDALRQRLVMAIDGKGAFRRFKDVLSAYPAERERWFRYRSEHLHWHITKWIEAAELQPVSPSPWGESGEPDQPEHVPLEVVRTDAPGEQLRKKCREILATLPALDLPTAVAFLEFLQSKAHEKENVSDSPVDEKIAGGL